MSHGEAMRNAELVERLRSYAVPSTGCSLRQLSGTVLAFLALFGGTLALAGWVSCPLALPLVPVTALFLLRIFIIQHDCGHYSYFRQRWLCDWVGRCLGVLTLTPYHWWKRDHDWHHATSGDLSRRGRGDIWTLTVSEYWRLSRSRRLGYRIYRHPAFLFLFGAPIQFLIRHRLPIGLRPGDRQSFLSIMGTNLSVAVLLASGVWFGGWWFLFTWLAILIVASIAGVWVFYVQHQFESTYWQHPPSWQFVPAVLEGCSCYRLPAPLEWLTGWIGYHHIHHLAPRIPNYRLRQCFRDLGDALPSRIITLRASLSGMKLALWAEAPRRLISFRDLAAGPSGAA